jgi:hypothetical protein
MTFAGLFDLLALLRVHASDIASETISCIETLAAMNEQATETLVFASPGDNRTQQGCQTRLFFRFPAATSAHRYAPKSNLFSAVHPIQRRAPWRKSKSI